MPVSWTKVVKIVKSLFSLVGEIKEVVRVYKNDAPEAEQEAAIKALCAAVVREASKYDKFVAENAADISELLGHVFVGLDDLLDD